MQLLGLQDISSIKMQQMGKKYIISEEKNRIKIDPCSGITPAADLGLGSEIEKNILSRFLVPSGCRLVPAASVLVLCSNAQRVITSNIAY